MTHQAHDKHSHTHGPGCGHVAVKHDGHTDYLHEGHMHHVHGDHTDEHTVAVGGANPAACTPGHGCATHHKAHAHAPGGGHEAVAHSEYTD